MAPHSEMEYMQEREDATAFFTMQENFLYIEPTTKLN
jgi:hypothetical protein